MLINLRNALMVGKKRVTFIEWLASDGTGYVDLQYAPTDPETRMLITASTSTAASNYAPLVCAGMNTAINDVTKPAFGFAPINNDRQIYLRCTRQHWWNKTANVGNWNDGDFHVIDIAQTGTRTCSAYLDGQSIETQWISNSTSAAMPTDTQTVFASKYNGEYYLKNSKFKVARIAYEVGGVIVHDFVAAKVGETCGFYDITTSKFIAGVGGLVAGPDVVPVEYIESHGTEWIDTGIVPDASTGLRILFQHTSNSDQYVAGLREGTGDTRWCVGESSAPYLGYRTVYNSTLPARSLNESLLNYKNDGKGVIFVSGRSATHSLSALGFTPTKDIRLFGAKGPSSIQSQGYMKASARIYEAQITQDSIPVRNYKSVRVGNEGAMMDVLTRRIYRNAGTGAFAYGNDLKYPIPAS